MSNNHPNRNWRSKWQIVADPPQAIHRSGLRVSFKTGEGVTTIAPDFVNAMTLQRARDLVRLLKEANELWS